jgi:integrase
VRDTQKEALAALDRLKQDLAAGIRSDLGYPVLKEWVELWMKNVVEPGLAPKTQSIYRLYVEKWIIPRLGHMRLSTIRPHHIQSLLHQAASEAKSQSYVTGLRATIRRALELAVRDEYIGRNPAKHLEPPKGVKAQLRRPFTSDEQIRILEACEASPYAGRIIKFILGTGCRLGEALGLTVDQIDQDKSIAVLASQLQRSKDGFELRELKTRTPRPVALIGPAKEAVEAALEDPLFDGYSRPLGLVFLGIEGRPWDDSNFRRAYRRVLEEAQVLYRSPHTLRHTVATDSLAMGADLFNVSKLLGHSQVALTANLYGHATLEGMRQAAEAANRRRVKPGS